METTISRKKNNKTAKPGRKTLTEGRPPHIHKPASSMRSKATKHLINQTHQLNKALAQATEQNDVATAATLEKRLADLGGLQKYQLASIQGQSTDRGGDSSIILLEFLQPLKATLAKREPKTRLLEIGALSTKNACARSGLFDLTRIDLHAQTPEIEQQDFMQRPLPHRAAEKFDVISLSLVLNFVPLPTQRGEMLRRTCAFLDRGRNAPRAVQESPETAVLRTKLPALFVVLPAPCLGNSRYFNEERLTVIMASLGYVLVNIKQTGRIVYSLWQLRDDSVTGNEQRFGKKQVNPGGGRNNFTIVLE